MVGDLGAASPSLPDAGSARAGVGDQSPAEDLRTHDNAAAEGAAGLRTSVSRPFDEQMVTASAQVPISQVAPPAAEQGSAPRQATVELLRAYADALTVADELPLFVPMRTRQRRAWLDRGLRWRPRWLLRTFLVHHISSVLDALERCYHRRAAVGPGTSDAQDVADRVVVDHFRKSLPSLHAGRLLTLLLISVLVVGQLSLMPLARLADEAAIDDAIDRGEGPALRGSDDGTVSDINNNGRDAPSGQVTVGADQRADAKGPPRILSELVGHAFATEVWQRIGKVVSRDDVGRLQDLIRHALATATLDFGSSRDLVNSLLEAGLKTIMIFLGHFLFILYLVTRLLVPSFRIKRVLFNLYPHVDQYLNRTSASWHVPRSLGTYQLETAAFNELGQQSAPKEKPFDLVVLALPMLSLLALAGTLAVAAGNRVSRGAVAGETYLLGIATAVAMGAVALTPLFARLFWLLGAFHQRAYSGTHVSPWGERVLADSRHTVRVRRPALLALVASVPYAVAAVLNIDLLFWFSWEVLVYMAELGIIVGFLVLYLSFPWWYRVTKELRNLGVERERPLGRWPGATVLLALVSGYGWIYLLAVTVRRTRRAQRLIGIAPSRVLLWCLPVSILLPPLLIWQLQTQLNKVWLRAGRPSPDDAPSSVSQPSGRKPSANGKRRQRKQAVPVAVVLTVLMVAAVKPAPDDRGDDLKLDAFWEACDAGNRDACVVLHEESPRGSRYAEFGRRSLPSRYGDDMQLDELWDACDAGSGDACLDLFTETKTWDSDYLFFAERNLPTKYGDSRTLDGLWDACEIGDGDACVDLFSETMMWDSDYSDFAGRNLPAKYGDSRTLDALWDACETGDGDACLDLYFSSAWNSEYSRFAEHKLPTGWWLLEYLDLYLYMW
jgi:hypothetical protein